jgi:hypothetical protein
LRGKEKRLRGKDKVRIAEVLLMKRKKLLEVGDILGEGLRH